MRPLRRLLLPLATLAALAATAPAQADDMVAEVTRDTPIAAYAGRLAWSAYDGATNSYRLMIAVRGGAGVAAPIAPSRQPFDVSLGPDAKRRVVALYTRCATAAGTRCDVYRYALSSKRESKLSLSSPREDEAWPAQWLGRVAFVRRHHRNSNDEVPDCDVPFVKSLTSSAPSRRLDRGSCGRTTGLSLRRDRIVQVTFGSPPTATRYESQVRVLRAGGGAVKVLARQGSGEESNEFASPNQAPDAIYLTRTGVHPKPAFVTIDLRRRVPKLREVRSQTPLTGAFARDNQSETFYYVEGSGYSGDGCAISAPVPCRIVRSSVSPFSPLPHALLPQMTITSSGERLPSPLYGDPYVVSGRVTRTVIHFGVVGRVDPIAGVTVALLERVRNRTDPNLPDTVRPTGISTTTDADGRWSITLAGPPSQPSYSAVTASPAIPTTYAPRATTGLVLARMTLTVAGTSFSGTIAPAQPGRTVKIQRLLSRNCRTFAGGQRFCDERWATVGEAPVNATGTGYAATVAAPQPGVYSATLPAADLERDPALYTGRTADTPVG
jgi:hypothetical protein